MWKHDSAAPVCPKSSYASCSSADGPAPAWAAAAKVTAVSKGWLRERARSTASRRFSRAVPGLSCRRTAGGDP
ncbi:hypothetical protein [Streptomyces sp. NBC_01615]|uniref:hypothetical protein n=1 Tax=Streptomyces sp. NBC_01615 TaxID=2975898 RepID=UPI00386BBBF3